MHIKTARKLVKWAMILSVVGAVAGMLFFEPGTTVSIYVTFISFGLMLAAVILLFTACKCPWCGKRITNGLMKVECCPFCKKDFDTGLKYKKKK